VERKSAADLFGTLAGGRRRFVRELERLQERCEYAAVVVEADWETLFTTPPEYSRLPPRNVFRSVVAYQQRYPRVHWWFCPGRRFAELTTFRVLERFWREDEERRRKTATDAGMTGTIMRVDVGGPPKGRHVFPQETDGKKKEEKGGGE
jgi:ERCC4-type nuclease